MTKVKLLTGIIFILNVNLFGQASKAYMIKGDITKVKAHMISKVYLSFYEGNKMTRDSCLVTKGKYVFKGLLKYPVVATLRCNSSLGSGVDNARKEDQVQETTRSLYLAPGTVNLVSGGSFTEMLVSGSKEVEDWIRLEALIKPVNDEFKIAAQERTKIIRDRPFLVKKEDQWTKEDSAAADGLKKSGYPDLNAKLYVIGKKLFQTKLDYVKKNPASLIGGYILCDLLYSPDANVEELKGIYSSMADAAKKTYHALLAKNMIEERWVTRIGQPAPEFSQPDTAGRIVNLSDFKGKYVFLDFWASSCGPCRAQMPKTLELFHRYKEKGFEVVAISNDGIKQKDAWLKAIKKDGTSCFVQLSDLKGTENEAAKKYYVTGLPTTYLLDKEGKILAKNLHGEELEKRMKEIFGE